MEAAVYRGPGELVVEERPVPALGPDQVLVEVSHCGVCGSDLHFVLDGWTRPGYIGGHETSGVVVGLSADAENKENKWSVGDRVVVGPGPTCGECRACLARRPSLCERRGKIGAGEHQGAFARYYRAQAAELVAVPDGLELRTAALTEPLAVALHALTLVRVEPGQSALVLGAGPIGLLVIASLRATGVDAITVSEPAPARRERALAVGAASVVEPSALVAPEMPYECVADAYDVAFECSGNAQAQEAALAQLRRAGVLVLVGAGMGRPRWNPNRILLNELVVTGANCYDHDGFDRALALLTSGRLPVNQLIEPDDVPLSGLLGAMLHLRAGELAGKVLVAPAAEGRA